MTALYLLLLLAAPAAVADANEVLSDPPDVDAGRLLDDAAVNARIDFIQQSLDAGQARANVWYWGFTGVQAGSAIVCGILIFAERDKPGALENNIISTAQSLLGFFGLIIDPMFAGYAHKKVRALPGSTADERREKLSAAESWLQRSAKREKAGRAWYNHVLGLAVGLTGGLLLAFAFEETDWKDGLLNFGIAVAVNELQIWTQPTKAIKDWDSYQATYGTSSTARRFRLSPPRIVASPMGVVAYARF